MFIEEQEIESANSDVESTASSEPSESPAEGEAKAAAPSKPEEATNVPFHEHPRWKEVMSERDTYKQSLEQQKQELAQLRQQYQALTTPKQEAPKDAMYERLKGIDPEFADYLKDVREKASKSEQLEQRLQQMNEQNFVQTAVAEVKNLHTANKVAPEFASLYEDRLDVMYRMGQIKSVEDVKNAYKNIHDQYSKALETYRRQDREAYTSAKKTDAKAPASQPKGKPPTQNGKFEFTGDSRTDKAMLIKRVAQLAKADTEI